MRLLTVAVRAPRRHRDPQPSISRSQGASRVVTLRGRSKPVRSDATLTTARDGGHRTTAGAPTVRRRPVRSRSADRDRGRDAFGRSSAGPRLLGQAWMDTGVVFRGPTAP